MPINDPYYGQRSSQQAIPQNNAPQYSQPQQYAQPQQYSQPQSAQPAQQQPVQQQPAQEEQEVEQIERPNEKNVPKFARLLRGFGKRNNDTN
jgi:S-DNA-T family DNA segregation ATPase FtsK/SpoIIIE